MDLVQLRQQLSQLEAQITSLEGRIKAMKEKVAYCQGKNVPVSEQGMCKNVIAEYTSIGGIRQKEKDLTKLKNQAVALGLKITAEEIKEEQYLKEQELLQQTFSTDKSEQEVKQEEAKAKQEIQKLAQEAAKAEAASRLAAKGNMEGARALLGLGGEAAWRKAAAYGGIGLLAILAGLGIYKLMTR